MLLVEDDDAMRRLLVEALERRGYEVEQAWDGKAALSRLAGASPGRSADVRPDVVVADVRMPRLTGLDILEGVGAEGMSLPVILVTGFGDADLHRLARRLGAAAVFDKPFEIAELVKAIERALAAAAGAHVAAGSAARGRAPGRAEG